MTLQILTLAIIICLFVSIVNYYYQKMKYKYAPTKYLKNLPLFEKPSTWIVCIVLSGILLAGIFLLSANTAMTGIANLKNLGNTNNNQYQTDPFNQDLDSEDTE